MTPSKADRRPHTNISNPTAAMLQRYLSDPPRPLHRRLLYDFVYWFCRLWLLIFWRIRIHGTGNVPQNKGMIICCNHQSNLDPIVAGCSLPCRTNYVAKASLFRVFFLGWLLTKLDGIPIDRDGGISGMRETLKRLKRGENILLFPEGTRSRDGRLLPLKAGFVTLARKTKTPLLPMALVGTFEAWPPGTSVPRPGTVHVVIGKLIQASEYLELNEDEILNLLAERISNCFEEATSIRERVLTDRLES